MESVLVLSSNFASEKTGAGVLAAPAQGPAPRKHAVPALRRAEAGRVLGLAGQLV